LCRLWGPTMTSLGEPVRWKAESADWFLGAWLGLEALGYLLLSPFPAARRVLGLVVVATLIVGRLASRNGAAPRRRPAVIVVASFSTVLGLLLFVVDWHDAHVFQEAMEVTARRIRENEPDAVIWYVGHWGLQYYAEREGMRPLVSRPLRYTGGRTPTPSDLHKGDWIVVPDPEDPEPMAQQFFALPTDTFERRSPIEIPGRMPLRTVVCYYFGMTPLRHHEGPRFKVELWHMTADAVPIELPRPETERDKRNR
jgi:hypothetical protein